MVHRSNARVHGPRASRLSFRPAPVMGELRIESRSSVERNAGPAIRLGRCIASGVELTNADEVETDVGAKQLDSLGHILVERKSNYPGILVSRIEHLILGHPR